MTQAGHVQEGIMILAVTQPQSRNSPRKVPCPVLSSTVDPTGDNGLG